jgi:hypothetical protein
VERIFRDLRINLIIEGTSEIMRLFIAREALDPHIQLAFDIILPGRSSGQRLKAALRAGRFYALWYPKQWIPPLPLDGMKRLPSSLLGHWVFIERTSRRLSRVLFHQMVKYQQRLEKKQMLLFRLVDVGVELFAMACTVSRAARLKEANAVELADLFCDHARRRIHNSFRALCAAEDAKGYRVAQELLKGKYAWLESGIVGGKI